MKRHFLTTALLIVPGFTLAQQQSIKSLLDELAMTTDTAHVQLLGGVLAEQTPQGGAL